MNEYFEIAIYASRNIPFYKNDCYLSFANDPSYDNFLKLPTVTKRDLRDHRDSFIFPTSNTKSRILRCNTSGTTGIPLSIEWNDSDFVKSNFYLWNFRKKFKILPSDAFCSFHSSVETNNETILEDMIIINSGRTLSLGRYVYNEAIIQKYIDAINNFHAKWIQGPSSCIYMMAKYLETTNQTLKDINYVELNGEFTNDSMREELCNILKVPISDLYGSVEFNGIAIKFNSDKFYVLNKNVYIETNDNEEILITGLVNHRMPLIRYKIGDRGIISEEICSNGYIKTLLTLNQGRSSDIILLPDGNKVDMSIFNNIVDDIHNYCKSVLQYYIKKVENQITLVILLKKECKNYFKISEEYFISKLKWLKSYGLSINMQIEYDEGVFFDGKQKYKLIRQS